MYESKLSTEAGRKYASAYDAHYGRREIGEACTLYEDIIANHQGTREAGYSRSQVRNIVNDVVSKEKILNALLELARSHFSHNVPLDADIVASRKGVIREA
jgi:hypothetical protein